MQTVIQQTLDIPLRWTELIARNPTPVSTLESAVAKFKRILVEADRQALKNNDIVPAHLVDDVENAFRDCNAKLRSIDSEELGAKIQSDLLPYLLLTNTAERWYSKPRGYAGDFLSIHQIYQNTPAGRGRIGSVLDRCFLNIAAAVAVRNRRPLLAEEINAVVAAKGEAPARITSLACGPAAEVFDVYEKLDDPTKLTATLIDIDLQALAFVAERRDRARLQQQMRLLNSNLVYLITGREQIQLRDQDLIYSIGLIDYFSDKFVIKLLNYIHKALLPGGKVILGNFHPRNPDKPLMDHLLDWRLIHRTEDDMNRLFRASLFQSDCSNMRFEQQGINLFAECVKK
ncbi:MAG TPA: class I SAM-dependent methyltransferase family protein [Pyrinomonadaceae bacterium]|nr:class I SAM-dependent methyltransferase family protein [Pyrinomonadaceae bacterium]